MGFRLLFPTECEETTLAFFLFLLIQKGEKTTGTSPAGDRTQQRRRPPPPARTSRGQVGFFRIKQPTERMNPITVLFPSFRKKKRSKTSDINTHPPPRRFPFNEKAPGAFNDWMIHGPSVSHSLIALISCSLFIVRGANIPLRRLFLFRFHLGFPRGSSFGQLQSEWVAVF